MNFKGKAEKIIMKAEKIIMKHILHGRIVFFERRKLIA